MQTQATLQSDLYVESELRPLIEHFVCRLIDKAERMSELLKSRRYDEIAQLAHQVQGAGARFGYPTLAEAARYVESTAKAECKTVALQAAIFNLFELCQQATRGLQAGACEFDPSVPPESFDH